MALYILLVVAGGGASGGLIYSLTTGDSHKLRMPFYQKHQKCMDIETGFFGHMFIGSFAGLLLIAIAISHLNFNPSALLDYSPSPNTFDRGSDGMSAHSRAAMTLLNTIGISMIGGFLGLKLIVKIADETYGGLNAKLKKLQHSVEEEEIEREMHVHILGARAYAVEGAYDFALKEIDQALRIRETKTAQFVKALILKRKKDFAGALAAVEKALKLDYDSGTKHDASLYWNKACYLALSNPSAIAPVIEALDESIKIKPEYKNDISTETDFETLVDKAALKKHFGLQ